MEGESHGILLLLFVSNISKIRLFDFLITCFLSLQCQGPSMEPSIHERDVLLTERVSVRMHVLPKDSVVIVRSLSDPTSFICKRLIAGPGDRIPTDYNSITFVPKGHVWLEGDNKANSSDSRSFGPVPFGLIRSRVVSKIWPLPEIGAVKPSPSSQE